jgi:hypothetical protein
MWTGTRPASDRRLSCAAFATLIACALLPASASVASVPEDVELLLLDGAAGDLFGIAVAVAGDTTLSGAVGANGNVNDSGAAYVFRYDGSTWVEEPKLWASDGAAGDLFGVSVAVDGDTAVVGAGRVDGAGVDSGAAYVFHYDGAGWVEEAKLTASDSAASDFFGYWVAVSGDAVLVGSVGSDGAAVDAGAAYLFRDNGAAWVEEAKLTAFDGTGADLFGRSVALAGSLAVVGAGQDDPKGENSGSAYVFRDNGANWVVEAKLTASDGADFDAFGMSVALAGDTIIVGAFGDDDNGGNSGSAYIFRYTGASWVEETKLTAPDGTEFDNFGLSVAAAGDTVAIGAIGDDDNGTDSGSAYTFHYSGTDWVYGSKFVAANGADLDAFGVSIALADDMAVVGSWRDDDNGLDAGSTLLFMVPAVPALPGIAIGVLALGLLGAGAVAAGRGAGVKTR